MRRESTQYYLLPGTSGTRSQLKPNYNPNMDPNMPRSALVVVFGLMIVSISRSEMVAPQRDFQALRVPSPSMSGQGQSRFVEIAIITAPSGPEYIVPDQQKPHETPWSSSPNDFGNAQTDISIEVIVDDIHQLFFNGNTKGWQTAGWKKKVTYNFQNVKTGDVIAIEGKDEGGYAGILTQINFLSGPWAGMRHVTEKGWVCSRHKPDDNSWLTGQFTNSGNVQERFLDAVGHGKRNAWPWEDKFDVKTFDENAEWFWTSHNYIVDKAFCRYEFDLSMSPDDRQKK